MQMFDEDDDECEEFYLRYDYNQTPNIHTIEEMERTSKMRDIYYGLLQCAPITGNNMDRVNFCMNHLNTLRSAIALDEEIKYKTELLAIEREKEAAKIAKNNRSDHSYSISSTDVTGQAEKLSKINANRSNLSDEKKSFFDCDENDSSDKKIGKISDPNSTDHQVKSQKTFLAC